MKFFFKFEQQKKIVEELDCHEKEKIDTPMENERSKGKKEILVEKTMKIKFPIKIVDESITLHEKLKIVDNLLLNPTNLDPNI